MTACLLMVAVVGCGSNREGLVEVSGVVTLDGDPVPKGKIVFSPESGRPASGAIDSEGRYELTTYSPGDGAKPGSYVVTITSQEFGDAEPLPRTLEEEMQALEAGKSSADIAGSSRSRITWLVPERYSIPTSSGLSAEVGGGEEINFALTSQPE